MCATVNAESTVVTEPQFECERRLVSRVAVK
jgi:hypothetical protein